jgi:hypothetical protein
MVYEGLHRFLFIVGLLIIILPVTWSAESDFLHSDGYVENDSQHTRFRDKRTLDFILHGLAQMLGYRLQRNSAQTATTASPAPPPTSPPTEPSKLVTQTTPATPSQIVFLSLSDVDLRRKQTATELSGHSADTDRNKHYPYGRYRIGPDYIRGGHNDRSNHYYKPDYSRIGYDDPYHGKRGNDDGKNSHDVRMGYNSGRGNSDHGKDGHSSDRSNYYRSRHRNDKVDEYFERIGHYIKDQFRGGKKDKDDGKVGHNSEKSNQLKNNGASKVEDHGSEGEGDKEHVRSEYSIKGSDGDQDSSKVSQGQHSGGNDADTPPAEQKEDSNKSDEDHDDKASNEADVKSPENTEQKETRVQKFQQENSKQEPLEEKEQSQNTEQEIAKKESVEQSHVHNSKEESDEEDSIDHNEGKQSKQEEDTKEGKHREDAYYNQIPAPSLKTWDEDFWNSQYSFADNNPYTFGLFDTQRSHKDEQKDLHKIPEFSFHMPSTDKDSKEFKSAQLEAFHHRPQYFDHPRFESVHEWHVSDRQSEKPSFGSGIPKESSEPQGEFKEEQETSDSVSDSPEDPSGNSAVETSEPSKPSTHRHDVTDSPPMPIHSTSKPKLAQLIHEMEGTKQNPLWPPPFDHAFESTDSSIVTHRPEQSDVTSSKKVPGHISPFLLNLYNYTSVSDYLLDLSKKGLLPKQAYRFSQQHTKNDHASQNQKSPVSYIALVIPNQSKGNNDNSVPPEPSFVGVVYPQRLLDGDTKEALSFTSAKSDNIKDNKTPGFKPLTKSRILNLSQIAPRNNRDEIQDPPLETHYNPLYHGISSALESIASSNISGGHIHSYPDSYITPFFNNPETRSNTNTQPYSITSASDYRTSDDDPQHAKHSAKNSYHYFGNDNPLFYSLELGSVTNVPLEGTLPNTRISNNSSLHGHSEKLQHGFPFYWLSLQDSEGNYKSSAETGKSSSALDSRTVSNYENKHIYDYPDTFHSSVLQNTGRNTKTNTSREGSSSALNFRHPSNSSEDTYSHIKNGNASDYPDVEYRIFQNIETQPLGSPVSHSSYSNYQEYQGDKVYSPSTFSIDGGEKSLSITKPLRLVIPDIQLHTTPGSPSPKLRVVIPDFPQSDSSFDYSSGNEQNELKNAAFEDNVGLMTIPPPTSYSDDPGSVRNPEKWVLGDDTPSSKNLKTKEYIRRVSKVHVTGKVQKQPKTNLERV